MDDDDDDDDDDDNDDEEDAATALLFAVSLALVEAEELDAFAPSPLVDASGPESLAGPVP